ncbi:MAG: hypothetical protein IJ282_05200 [Lachnospiraceae bacterium]|nr:hypothetical protein [Lachnospiraceae bacterium]
MEWQKNSKLAKICEKIVFPIILFLYPLNHICYGVEWADTGYNYANFAYIDNMDPMWKFSTFLANVVGNFFTHLPFGNHMVGLNFYTGLSISVLALWAYFFFVKKIKMPAVLVFVAEVIAVGLCWCPTSLLYNYLTYILMFAAVICLYQALTGGKKVWFVVAGIALGVNVFVRFSNLAQIAFIVGVWAYGIICKKKIKEICGWTGWCVLGYIIGFGGLLGIICLCYGGREYFSSITRLFGMTQEATEYTAFSMVEAQIRNYVQNLKWWGLMMPFMFVGFVGFAVLPRHLLKLKKVGYVFCMALVFYWLRNQNMYNFDYNTIESMFQWAVCLLTVSIIMGVYVIFSKKTAPEEKLLCGLTILIALLTPLGSNNHLNASINNLFFGAPVILWMLWKLLARISEKKIWTVKGKQIFLYSYPFKALIGMVVTMLLVQSLLFGATYVFREYNTGKNLNTKVENSDILKGMYTNKEKAALLEETVGYVQENGLTGKEVILYGNIPAVSYFLEMPFAISPWPDLASYNYQVMFDDLSEIKKEIADGQEAPVIILDASYGTYLTEGGELPDNRKFALLAEFAAEYEYELKFANEKLMLFESMAN